MLRVDKETLDRMESQYEGIIEQIMGFENAVLPSCPHCQSDNIADVQAGVIGRAVYIAAAAAKFKLILNGPRPGKYYCNECGTYFGVADSQPGGFTDRPADRSFQAFKKFFDDFTSALQIKGTVSEERLLQTWRKLWNLPPDASPEKINERQIMSEPKRALSIKQPYAEMILRGVKTVEYRSQITHIRERVYIYASKTPGEKEFFEKLKVAPGDLPVGVLVGTVEITGCTRKQEKEYQWHLANPERLPEPIKPENRPQPVWFHPFG
jgi:hypothetical protein